MHKNEHILVVDDQATQRMKLAMAVRELGHEVDSASDGKEALLKVRSNSYDLILLDILMPDMDGFEVMEFLKKDPSLRDIPIIVISALDSEMSSVVKAIELGAQDFLPKHFDPVLLRARIDASLVKKRNRDREQEYFKEVSRLTDAATILEGGQVDPRKLNLQDMTERDDALGNLARVFTSMASEVYERERKLNQQVRTLRSIGFLFAVGVVTGLGVVLTRIASIESPSPLGNVLWVNAICATVCFGSAIVRGKLPKLDRRFLSTVFMWAFFASVMGEAVIFWVAQHLQASFISLILVCDGFIVFAIASIIKIEKATMRRLFGFVVGGSGVAMAVFATQDVGGVSAIQWAVVAMLAPLGYALRSILITLRLPEDIDVVAATGWSAFAAVMLIFPVVLLQDGFVSLQLSTSPGGGILALALILFGIVTAASVSMRLHLIRTAGAVFASQSSFVVTFAGIAWSMILLGETLPKIAWVALVLLIVGLLLVGPKEQAEEEDGFNTRIDHEL